MSEDRLTPTSYVILGLVELLKTATPYDLKRGATLGVGHFWSLPHTQLYSEPARLAEEGYLDERRERERPAPAALPAHAARARRARPTGGASRRPSSTSSATPAC